MAVLPLLAEGGGSIGTSWEGSDASVRDAERLRTAADAAGVGLWSWDVDTDAIALDERTHVLWGVPRDGGPYTFADLWDRIHPPDRDRVRAAFAAARAAPGPYQIDFRIEHGGGAIRWVSAHGRGGDEGIVGRTMFGAFLDSTERKAAEEARDLLAGEMGHQPGEEPVRHRVRPDLHRRALRRDDGGDGLRSHPALADARAGA